MNKRQVGARQEAVAAEYLRGKGYRILERNYRNDYGEIDIIAEDGRSLVFVEVKFRSAGDYGDPLEAVDRRKQKRISRAAMRYYSGQGKERPCRFDVIALYGDGSIRHLADAFEYQ